MESDSERVILMDGDRLQPDRTDSFLRLIRPLSVRMAILRISGTPVTSNSGAVQVTHIGDRALRFTTPLSIPPMPPILLGFELGGEAGPIRFEGVIESRCWREDGYEYTVRLDIHHEDYGKLRKLSALLVEATVKELENAASSYKKLGNEDGLWSSGRYI